MARERLVQARLGRLATVTDDHRPHIVPCCFVLDRQRLYSAVDSKPKTTPDLRRIRNLQGNASFSLLVDHYEEDWTSLWWVRVDGVGWVVKDSDERARGLDLLAEKYSQYRLAPPSGTVLALDIETWRTWP